MYRHLLVPVDGTSLSTETVGQAVELARSLGARLTFFHATPDYQSSLSGDAEVVWTTSPGDFVYAFEGRARELLSKAEAAARAYGVPCDSMSTVSDRPHEAILDAVRSAGCDLIFMASHGRRSALGMALGSQTMKVLMNTEIPVLVAATRNPAPAARAIGIIRDEHRSLAAVLHGWTHLIAQAKRTGASPDVVLMQAMVRYIRDFPLKLHHPKEDEYLFARLRERTSSVNADLEELERQHARDQQMVGELAALVDRCAAGAGDLDALDTAVAGYCRFIWDHMGREESLILPAAQRYLTESDWAEIDAAFLENRDPRFDSDTDRAFKHLFSRIVNLAGDGARDAAAH
jgi:nucleotide-binding universal stress UspA family protein/hemerythrin-like domain-containing protein